MFNKLPNNGKVKKKLTCRYFSSGYCRFGDACWYSHEKMKKPLKKLKVLLKRLVTIIPVGNQNVPSTPKRSLIVVQEEQRFLIREKQRTLKINRHPLKMLIPVHKVLHSYKMFLKQQVKVAILQLSKLQKAIKTLTAVKFPGKE